MSGVSSLAVYQSMATPVLSEERIKVGLADIVYRLTRMDIRRCDEAL